MDNYNSHTPGSVGLPRHGLKQTEYDYYNYFIGANMRRRLHNLLVAFRYQSHSGRGMRGLQQHHIDALIKDLSPFIEEEVKQAYNEGRRSQSTYTRPGHGEMGG